MFFYIYIYLETILEVRLKILMVFDALAKHIDVDGSRIFQRVNNNSLKRLKMN